MTAGSIIVPTIIPLRAPVLGRPKHIIDSNTRIEIKSESQNVDIYYTMDGGKPEPFAALGTDRSTFKYRGPFTLPEGKLTVKAMGCTKDGIRQSNINTKVFEVEYVKSNVTFVQEDDDKAFQNDLVKEKNKRSLSRPYRQAWNEDSMDGLEANMTDMRVGGSNRRQGPNSARFTSNRFSQSQQMDNRYADSELTDSRRISAPNPYKQTMKLQKQTDFLRCTYCFADRPSDPYARFCHTCGNAVPPLPTSRLPPPEPGEMGRCVYCNSMVPLNTSTCVVCEASIPQQNQPQMGSKISQSKVCQYCGTGNPATLSVCILCENTLPVHARAVQTRDFAPPTAVPSGQERECSACHRVNNADARFCDWCGAKPTPQGVPMTCSRCGATNNLYAAFCASCGVSVSAPNREVHNSTMTPNSTAKVYWAPGPSKGSDSVGHTPSPVYLKPKPPFTVSSSTQTVGLFYPSEREIQKKRMEEEEKWAMEKQLRDRKPLLTSVSPGKGYWRKQMEHITTHLKAEAQNNPEFRALIGESRMGKLTAVSVAEDGFELTLTASYALRGIKDPYKIPPMSGSKVLSDLTHRRRNMDSESSEDSDERNSIALSEESESFEKTRLKPKSKKKSTKKEPKLSPEDRKLLKEVSKNGEGRAEEVSELITEGANPSVCSAQGTPALVLATMNKYVDCLPALLECGADINGQDKNGNTALHSAITLGYEGKEFIDILLSHGASLAVKNSKGQTPRDVAISTGNDSAVKSLTSSLGQSQLDKMSKPGKSRSSKMSLF